MKDTRLYILMRNDLESMAIGRAMAQASHASNAFIKQFGNVGAVIEWQNQTNQGFGTSIVLAASYNEIKEVFYTNWSFKIHKNEHTNILNYVVDPEYSIKVTREVFNLIDTHKIMPLRSIFNDDDNTFTIFRSEVTCAYMFGTKEQLDPILGHLKLHP